MIYNNYWVNLQIKYCNVRKHVRDQNEKHLSPKDAYSFCFLLLSNVHVTEKKYLIFFLFFLNFFFFNINHFLSLSFASLKGLFQTKGHSKSDIRFCWSLGVSFVVVCLCFCFLFSSRVSAPFFTPQPRLCPDQHNTQSNVSCITLFFTPLQYFLKNLFFYSYCLMMFDFQYMELGGL